MTSDGNADDPRAWVRANKHRLPRTYAEFSDFTLIYRRVIYQELTPETRAQLWTDHLARYLDAHPDLSPEQRLIIADAQDMVGQPDLRQPGEPMPPAHHSRLKDIERRAIEAFGRDEVRDLLATLGPPERPGSNEKGPESSG
jgi:hypothetical protein